MIRPLIIDDEARAKAAKVLAYAEAHPYYPRQTTGVPSDDPNFVAMFNTYRAVFTFTHSDGSIYRHLSISVPGSFFANPAAVFTIAALFGFSGWDERTIDRAPGDWMLGVNEDEHCVTVVQECGREQ